MAKKTKQIDKRTSNIPKKKIEEKGSKVLVYIKDMSVADVAKGLRITTADMIKRLMSFGVMANMNQTVDKETIQLIAIDCGFEMKNEVVTDKARFDEFKLEDDKKDLKKRPPVVTIMGHVDHGKTTLLDSIRNARVVSQEAGGITQHIGAYQIERNKQKITFIDTPGHAAFTEMRARGAKVTDITILVVAADDGVKPQTVEAIAHAKAAKVPIIVAVNKMDKPAANPEKVMQELANYDLLPESWGGKTIFVNISALTGKGIDELLDMIQLTAEMEDLTANPNRLASGTVIEARLDKGNGPTATFIIQNGTLKVGDNLVVGNTYGKIRTMRDDNASKFENGLPSMALEVTGLDEVPAAGDKFMAIFDERSARTIASERTSSSRSGVASKAVSLEEMFAQIKEGQMKELNLIVKADTQGSVEAIKGSIEKIDVEEIRVNIVSSSVGTITNTDVSLANASNAIIIGFGVRPIASVREEASSQSVEIRLYNIIYKVLEDIEAAMKGMLDPIYEEIVTGQAEVRSLFKVSKVGTIAGCFVTNGVIERNSLVRLLRQGVVVYEGKMASLKRFKDDAKEVKQGFECGIVIENYNDVKESDIIEASVMKEKERK